MLKNEQIRELLKRCEKAVDKELSDIRCTLNKKDHKVAAIWELLVIDELSTLGDITHEPTDNTPDVLLSLGEGIDIWFEASFLYRRDKDDLRKIETVGQWINQKAKSL